MMRTLFIGGTKRGYRTLLALLEAGQPVCGVISLLQDPHELERFEGPIRELAVERGLPLLETRWMKERDYPAIIGEELKPDIALIVGCRIMIPRSIYALPPLGTLAVHDSLLPDYRGFAPLNWSIINDESETGVTLFHLSDLMDGGDIVGQKRVPIGSAETAPELYEKVCDATVDLVLECWPKLADGSAVRIRQHYSDGSFGCSRTPVNGMIDWSRPTREIFNLIRSLSHPYPGAFTFRKGERLIVRKALPLEAPPVYRGRIPGRVVAVNREEGSVDVLTGDGVIRIMSVENDGREVEASKVVISVKESLGIDVLDLIVRVAELEKTVKTMTSANTG